MLLQECASEVEADISISVDAVVAALHQRRDELLAWLRHHKQNKVRLQLIHS